MNHHNHVKNACLGREVGKMSSKSQENEGSADAQQEAEFLPYDVEAALRRGQRFTHEARTAEELEYDRLRLTLKNAHVHTRNYRQARFEFLRAVANAFQPDHEGTLLMIAGPTKSGRTHMLERFARHSKLQPRRAGTSFVRPLLKVDVSAGDHRLFFAADLWRALNWLDHDLPPPALKVAMADKDEIMELARGGLRAQMVRLIMIDGLDKLKPLDRKAGIEEAAETLCPLLLDRQWPVSIVAAGCTDDANVMIGKVESMMIDETKALRGKTKRIDLRPLGVGDIATAKALLAEIEPQLALVEDPEQKTKILLSDKWVKEMLTRSNGQVGLLLGYAKDIAEHAYLRDGTARESDMCDALNLKPPPNPNRLLNKILSLGKGPGHAPSR